LYSEKTELNIKIPCKTGDFLSQQSNYVPIIKENQENKKLSKKVKKHLEILKETLPLQPLRQ
ncbi:hypothetical protein, partial [Flavobacterium covae]|uniref:hypothetical protein n=1 Tax=Flavobacterium covae TaxID=2906076 RepID=UPI003398407F